MSTWQATRSSSRRTMTRSSGRPTERFERIVESIEISAHLAASPSGMLRRITRSMIGLPYFDSPIWKYVVSGVASMKLPAA